jgi:hypothetical protein
LTKGERKESSGQVNKLKKEGKEATAGTDSGRW